MICCSCRASHNEELEKLLIIALDMLILNPVAAPRLGSAPKWLEATMKNSPVSIESPSTTDLGIQAGVYGALMALTYANGASTSSTGLYSGADVSGLVVASSFAASLYFMTKKNVKLGKGKIIMVFSFYVVLFNGLLSFA